MAAGGARRDAAERRRRFVTEYLKDQNGAAAAARAGFPASRAKQTAWELMQRPDVQAEIAAAMAERAERTQIDADWVLTRLAAEAEADLADLYTAEGALKPVHEWPLIWRQGLVAGVETDELRQDGAVMGSIRKVKLSDRAKRLEMLGKHVNVGAFRDKVELTGANGAPLVPVLNVTIGGKPPE